VVIWSRYSFRMVALKQGPDDSLVPTGANEVLVLMGVDDVLVELDDVLLELDKALVEVDRRWCERHRRCRRGRLASFAVVAFAVAVAVVAIAIAVAVAIVAIAITIAVVAVILLGQWVGGSTCA
jgi:Flp pilus assembly protein TadB